MGPDAAEIVVRFVAPRGERVLATQAANVVGLLDVAGYAARGVAPDDALDYPKAAKILGIRGRSALLRRESESEADGACGTVIVVRMGSSGARAAESRVRALGSGSVDDPIVHEGDAIATSRAVLGAAGVTA